jgi:hypothetical protein
LVPDDLDLARFCTPTEDGCDPVSAIELLAVLVEQVEDLARRQWAVRVDSVEH